MEVLTYQWILTPPKVRDKHTKNMEQLMEIDGSQLEGGGQILRMATAFSAILGIPIHVTKIRGGRTKGGLRPQHLSGIVLIKDICGGRLEGGAINSMEIRLFPQKIRGGTFVADTHTAGSVSLLIQSTLPCALFGSNPTNLTLRGGTNADMAPQVDYTIEVFQKICAKFGIFFDISLNVRGFFPVGQGEAVIKVKPLQEPIKPVEMIEQGEVIAVKGYSFVAGVLPIKMAHTMADAAEEYLKQRLGTNIRISFPRLKESPAKAVGNGSAIILWAETSTGCILGASGLGKRGANAEDIGRKAAEELMEAISSKACVDQYAQDQVIMLMALAEGKSKIRTSPLTLHSQTCIHIAKLMTEANFYATPDDETNTIILECDGVGIKPH